MIKQTWRYVNKLQVNCLKAQRESIEWLTADLERCKKERDNYKAKYGELHETTD